MPAYTIVDNIREACLPYGSITTFKAYVEKADAYVSEPPNRPIHYSHPSLREQLQLYGVGLSYYSPSTRSTIGERQLLVDMMLFALDNPAPSTVIILITAEELSPYAISALRLRHYKLVLITPQNNGNPLRPSMAAQANEVIDWASVMSKGRRSPAEGHSSPGSVSSVSTTPVSPSTRRMTPAGTVSSGGTVVDTAPAPRPLSTHSASSRSSSIAQRATSLTNPTPLFPSGLPANPGVPFQPFRTGAFTPRSQPGLNRLWGQGFPPSTTLFPTALNTSTTSGTVGQGPQSAVSSSSSSLASPSSNWTQSPPPASRAPFGPVGGPLGAPLSPTEPSVQRTSQFQPAEPRVPTQPALRFQGTLKPSQTPPALQNYPPPTQVEPTKVQRQEQQQHPQQQQQAQQHAQQQAQQQAQHILHHHQQLQQQQPRPMSLPQMQMPQPHALHQFPLPHAMGGPSFGNVPHIDPRHFDLLINILTEFRNEGKIRPYRSKIGSELVQRDRLVYQRAGVVGFKDYVGYAEQMGLVRLGGHAGSPGKEWIELIVSEQA